ncbi:MAG: hypothetical protein U0324_29005 [Polyangiales bacterium]
MMNTMRWGLGASLMVALAGCATTAARRGDDRGAQGSARVAAPFPTRDALQHAMSAAPARPNAAREPTAVLEQWELAGPFPAQMGSRAATSLTPFARMLDAHAQRSGGRMVLSEAMQCTARELGRYMVGHEGAIPQPLADFVTGRCGSAGAFLGAWMSRGRGPATGTEEHLVERFQGDLATAVQEFAAAGAGAVNVGAWFGRDGERFMFLMAMEARRVAVEPLPFTADAQGRVTVEGRMLEATGTLTGLVNRGAWSSQPCESDPSVRLPHFRVRCPLAPDDAVARVELSATAPGRLLGHTVFSAVVGPGRDAARRFEVRAADAALVATDPARARDALLTALNDARTRAGVAPVTLAAREADVACQAAPVYFSLATDASAGANVDQIALGLMAGWDVSGGMIREGTFFSGAGAQEDDMGRWVAWALERPLGRRVLLDGDVRQVAACPWAVEGHTQGVLWSSYRFYQEGTQAQEVERVFARLDAARRAAGRSPAVRLTHLDASLRATAQSIERTQGDPEAALQAMLDGASNATGASTRGWVLATTDLESVEFPRDMVEAGALRASVQVAHWRGREDAWGQAVVFLVVQ